MSQHPAYGLNRHARFKGDERGERVTSDMVAEILLYPCQYRQCLHVVSQARIVNHREQGVPIVIMIFLYQGDGFRQQFHACAELVLFPAVFQPQFTVLTGVQVLFGDGHGIAVGYPGIAGEEEQVPCQTVGRAVRGYFHIADFLETLPAQCLWRLDGLFREDIMLEHEPLGMAFLIGFPARLLDNRQVMPCGIYCMAFPVKDEILVIMDELFGKLPESKVLCLEPGFNELTHGTAGKVVRRICPFCPVYPDTALYLIPEGIQHFHQGHPGVHAALEGILDCRRVKIGLAFQKGVEGGIDVEQ